MEEDMAKGFSKPTYVYAGGSVGGTNIMVCGQCSVLVLEEATVGHTYWHEKLDAVLYGTTVLKDAAPKDNEQ